MRGNWRQYDARGSKLNGFRKALASFKLKQISFNSPDTPIPRMIRRIFKPFGYPNPEKADWGIRPFLKITILKILKSRSGYPT